MATARLDALCGGDRLGPDRHLRTICTPWAATYWEDLTRWGSRKQVHNGGRWLRGVRLRTVFETKNWPGNLRTWTLPHSKQKPRLHASRVSWKQRGVKLAVITIGKQCATTCATALNRRPWKLVSCRFGRKRLPCACTEGPSAEGQHNQARFREPASILLQHFLVREASRFTM